MCDEQSISDMNKLAPNEGIGRSTPDNGNELEVLAAKLPQCDKPFEVIEREVLIPAPDGEVDCYWVHPSSGSHAAVIMWPDVAGVRPGFWAMARRLAESGYAVLAVNPYYRSAKGQVIPRGKTIADPGVRELVNPLKSILSPQTCVADGQALIRWLDQQPEVDAGRGIGVVGFCMSGSYVFHLAAAFPDRVKAGCSFHGGRLVIEAPDSPHKLVDKIQAGMLVAIATNDDEKNPEAKHVLRRAFDRSGVDAEMEIYEGALHGWMPPDSRAFNQAQSARGWGRMLVLFEKYLG